MTDETPNDKSKVQLTPGTPASPKLAVVSPGPQKVVVSVPMAKTVAVASPKDAGPIVGGSEDEGPVKKGALLDQIVETTGVKRSDAKAVLDSVLAVLGDHLQAGDDLQLPPLGKVKVVKSKPVGNGATAFTIKVRTPNPG